MRRTIVLALVSLAGCSTAPLADLLDAARPAGLRAADGQPFHGGVVIPMDPTVPVPQAQPVPFDPGPALPSPPPPDPVGGLP